MATWHGYSELLTRLAAQKELREAAGESPPAHLMQAMHAYLASAAQEHDQSRLCALPDDVIGRAMRYFSNHSLGATSSATRRLKQLILPQAAVLFRPKVDCSDAVRSVTTSQELARFEVWASALSHDFQKQPRLRGPRSFNGLLCLVKIVQYGGMWPHPHWRQGQWCDHREEEVQLLPPLEPVVLVSGWLALEQRDVVHDGDGMALAVQLPDPFTIPHWEPMDPTQISLEISLYDPEKRLATTLYDGPLIEDRAEYDNTEFWCNTTAHQHEPFTHVHVVPRNGDDDDETVFNGTGRIEIRFGLRPERYYPRDDDVEVYDEEDALDQLCWRTVSFSEPRRGNSDAGKVKRALHRFFEHFSGEEVDRMPRQELCGRVALAAGANVAAFYDFIEAFAARCIPLHPGKFTVTPPEWTCSTEVRMAYCEAQKQWDAQVKDAIDTAERTTEGAGY